MEGTRRPLQGLLEYIGQIVSATGRYQDFQELPFFYIIVESISKRSALHVRAFQAESVRIIELGEGWIGELLRTIRMREDGFPVASDDFGEMTPYQIEQYATRNWIDDLKRDRYLQQAALSYTAILSRESPVWCPIPEEGLPSGEPAPVSEQHYNQCLQPQEGILLCKRVGPQPIAKAVREQYFERIEDFCSSKWLDTAIARATVAARFNGIYYVVISPVHCYTTWDSNLLLLPVNALLHPLPQLLNKDGLLGAQYTNEQGAVFVNSGLRREVKDVLRRSMFKMVRSRDLHFLYCPNCGQKVAKSIVPPPYTCTRCSWKQEAWR